MIAGKMNCSTECSLDGTPRAALLGLLEDYRTVISCGGVVEYRHRSPASRRRRQKGKSRI
jgi:hypothetical protein